MIISPKAEESAQNLEAILKGTIGKYLIKQKELFSKRDEVYTKWTRYSELHQESLELNRLCESSKGKRIRDTLIKLEQNLQDEMKEVLTKKKELENLCKVELVVNYINGYSEIALLGAQGILSNKLYDELLGHINKRQYTEGVFEGVPFIKTKLGKKYNLALQSIISKLNSSEDFKQAKLELSLALLPPPLVLKDVAEPAKKSYTIAEAAKLLGYSTAGIRYQIKTGKLYASKKYGKTRVQASELEEQIADKTRHSCETSDRTAPPSPQGYSVGDVARKEGLDYGTVWRLIKNGRIRADREGKHYIITEGALNDFENARKAKQNVVGYTQPEHTGQPTPPKI